MDHWFLTCLFAQIGSVFIDHETCPRACLIFVFGKYSKRADRFTSSTGLCKVVLRVPVGCSYLFPSIDCFDWSKISFKFFVQALFCWLLYFVYFVYWISVHWYWNLSLGVLENCLWAVSKWYIQLFFPRRFVEVHGEGASCVVSLVVLILRWLGHPSFLEVTGGGFVDKHRR